MLTHTWHVGIIQCVGLLMPIPLQGCWFWQNMCNNKYLMVIFFSQACLDEHHLLTQAVIENFSKEEDGERKLDWDGELQTSLHI